MQINYFYNIGEYPLSLNISVSNFIEIRQHQRFAALSICLDKCDFFFPIS